MVESAYKRTKRLAYERGYAAGQEAILDRWIYGEPLTWLEIINHDLRKSIRATLENQILDGSTYNTRGTESGRISCSGPN